MTTMTAKVSPPPSSSALSSPPSSPSPATQTAHEQPNSRSSSPSLPVDKQVDSSLNGIHHQHLNNPNLNHHHQPKSKSVSPPKPNAKLASDNNAMQIDSTDPPQSSGATAMNDQLMGGPVPPTGVTVPVRPPPRPFKRANLSLEQNPFEVSFSQSSSGAVPSAANPPSPRANSSNEPSRPESNDGASNNNAHSRNPSDADGPKSSPKPTLPPLSAIAEPTQEPTNSFPWGFSAALSDAGSLRAGPLSPAMLQGPRQQDGAAGAAAAATHPHSTHGYFDAPSLSFRTGLTPGLGRTGLTPLVGGPASFPPPSPNTAAFLAMVTNGAGGAAAQAVSQLTGGATITPNTLSALTGSLIQHANQSGDNSAPNPSSQAPPPSSQNGQHPLAVSRPAFGQQTQNYPNNQHPDQSYRGPVDSYPAAAQNAAAAAANGLFLLSQAHQELTKREEQQQAQAQADAAAAAAAASVNIRGAQKRSSTMNSNAPAVSQNGHNKRKSGDSTAPTPTSRPSNAKRARGSTGGTSTTVASAASVSPVQPTRSSTRRRKSEATFMGMEVASPDDDDGDSLDDEDMGATPGPPGSGKPKKFETEEEKRRNFLERNRQGMQFISAPVLLEID